ncbi:MAG: hypothetical protein ACOX0K_05370 [Oscillospiraceae bacterium]|jgi:hypothetical protein
MSVSDNRRLSGSDFLAMALGVYFVSRVCAMKTSKILKIQKPQGVPGFTQNANKLPVFHPFAFREIL